MFKVIALLKKKDGLSKDEFIRYYEDKHVPLVRSLFPWTADYSRKYIDMADVIYGSGVNNLDFDVITEMSFEDKSGYDRMMKKYEDSAVFNQVADDEEHFLDRKLTRFFLVDEHIA